MSEHPFEPEEHYDDVDAVEDQHDADHVPVEHHDVGGRRKKSRGVPGCLAVLVAILVVGVVAVFGVMKGAAFLKDRLASPDDFTGPGHGRVMFEVHEGDTLAAMGRALKSAGVVESVEAFTDAAAAEPAALGIQVGIYQLQKEMPAAEALNVLINADNLVRNTVTIPEGLRLTDILDVLAKKTDFKRAEYERVLKQPDAIGLPSYAEGNPEGYLFPSTYDIGPKDQPVDILTAMVDRWRQAADDADLEGAAARLGYTPAELMIVASLVEAEARGKDMPKVARVIYNRLETDGAPTYGLLQVDATVNYGLQQELGVALTQEQLQQDTPYNTYKNPGLPPTPIEAPGDAAIAAAANPADGNWFFYVTVNLRTGKTEFAETYEEFLKYKAQYEQYCTTSEAC